MMSDNTKLTPALPLREGTEVSHIPPRPGTRTVGVHHKVDLSLFPPATCNQVARRLCMEFQNR
jgi:hypothetical protein